MKSTVTVIVAKEEMTHNYLKEQSWKKLCLEACQIFRGYEGKKTVAILQYQKLCFGRWARRILIIDWKLLCPWVGVPRSALAAVLLELLTQSVLYLPKRCHFYLKWKVQRMERLLESRITHPGHHYTNSEQLPAVAAFPLLTAENFLSFHWSPIHAPYW